MVRGLVVRQLNQLIVLQYIDRFVIDVIHGISGDIYLFINTHFISHCPFKYFVVQPNTNSGTFINMILNGQVSGWFPTIHVVFHYFAVITIKHYSV